MSGEKLGKLDKLLEVIVGDLGDVKVGMELVDLYAFSISASSVCFFRVSGL